MTMRDISSDLDVQQSLAPAARTASTNGSGVPLQGYSSAMVLIETGTITDGTHTFEVQESDDNTTYTAVADAELVGAEPAVGATDDNKVYRIGYLGTKAYVRVAVTVAGATSGGVYSASIVRGRPHVSPVA